MASSSSSCAAEQHNEDGGKAFKSRDYDTAYRCYSKAIKANPAVPKYWTNRANTMFRLGLTRQVLDDTDAAIKADPACMKAYYFRGLAHEKLGNVDQALQALHKAAQLDPGNAGITTALNRCVEAKAAARSSNESASTDSFYEDTRQAEAMLQQAVQGMLSSPPSQQQQQQFRQHVEVEALVMHADKLRYVNPPMLKEAAAMYKRAGELGSASGQFDYAQMIQLRHVDEPLAAAVPWLLKAAAQEPMLACMPGCPNVGVVESWVTLGDFHRDGLTGNAPDYAEAMRWYLKAAEGHNNAMAQNNIGRAYLTGEGVPKDDAAAASWYRKAADQGYGVSEYNLAVMLRNGAPGVPQDLEAALALARRAEQHGFAQAAELQAALEPSCAVAAAQMRALAESGDPAGCLLLAQAYHAGLHGCEKDLRAANKWLLAAAAGKLPAAQLHLGLAYKIGGWGCERSLLKAVSNIEKAAHQGLAQAQLEAAVCHMTGIGTKVDFSKAQQWAAKAAEQGNQEAAKLLLTLEDGCNNQWGKDWSKMLGQMHKSVPKGATQTEAADAMFEELLSISHDGCMPEELKQCMREVHRLPSGAADNPASTRSSTSSKSPDLLDEVFPMEQLLQYSGSAVIQPIIQAKLCLMDGLELCLEQGQLERGYQALARGYALCHSVMVMPRRLFHALEQHLSANPGDACAALVHTMGGAFMRGIDWAEQRLGQLLPGLPGELQPHVQLLRSQLRVHDRLSDYAGAIADADAVLKLLPGNPDALYVRAEAMHARMHNILQRGAGRSNAAAADEESEVEAALHAFLAAAPPEHSKRPDGFYMLAFHMHLLYCRKGLLPGSAAGAAAAKEVVSMFEAGLAAEADLPPFFLPVRSAMKTTMTPAIRMLRAANTKSAAAAVPTTPAAKEVSDGAGSSNGSRGCDVCGAAAEKLMRCSRCQQRRFCSKACQAADWKDGHSRLCGKRVVRGTNCDDVV